MNDWTTSEEGRVVYSDISRRDIELAFAYVDNAKILRFLSVKSQAAWNVVAGDNYNTMKSVDYTGHSDLGNAELGLYAVWSKN